METILVELNAFSLFPSQRFASSTPMLLPPTITFNSKIYIRCFFLSFVVKICRTPSFFQTASCTLRHDEASVRLRHDLPSNRLSRHRSLWTDSFYVKVISDSSVKIVGIVYHWLNIDSFNKLLNEVSQSIYSLLTAYHWTSWFLRDFHDCRLDKWAHTPEKSRKRHSCKSPFTLPIHTKIQQSYYTDHHIVKYYGFQQKIFTADLRSYVIHWHESFELYQTSQVIATNISKAFYKAELPLYCFSY